MKVPCKNIPTYDFNTNKWSTTSFNDQLEFGDYLVEHCFKEPGEYQFEDFVNKWNELGRTFEKEGLYTDYADGTSEYYEFWDDEEYKSRLGVLWKYKDRVYYTTRCYYFLLNYCPIPNKEQDNNESFCSIRDVQYHLHLYLKLSEIFHLHSAILKRRQMMYSCCNVAKSVNYLWFENTKRIKWIASDMDFLTGVDGSWAMLEMQRNHLNTNTDWGRNFHPDKAGEIRQGYEFKDHNGRWVFEGNGSSITCFSIGKDPKEPVGGPAYFVWNEEGGISKNSSTTLQYMEPAMVSGTKRTGTFSIGGSVGDLKECADLEEFMKNPELYGMYAVPTKWADESKNEVMRGLFIPAQYGMPEATDEFGNSLPDLALELLYKAEHVGFKKGEYGRTQNEKPWKELPPEKYILKKSQQPKTIKEAFAYRRASEFNVQKIERRQEQIKIQEKNGEITKKQGHLYEDKNGVIKLKALSTFQQHDRPVELGYPISKKLEDKRGVVTIWEEPLENVSNVYFAGVDPVASDDNNTTNSVMSVHIYKRGIKKISTGEDGKQKVEYVGSKIVASYRGRFRTTSETNEQGWYLIRYYKAFAAIERNRPNFINYGRLKSFNRYIARESDMPLNKDLKFTMANTNYGFWMDNQGNTRKIFVDTIKEYLNREISTIHKKTKDGTVGEVVKTIRGIDFIDDYWFLEELKLYTGDANADSVVSGGAALCIGYIREMEYEKQVITETKQPQTNTQPKQPKTFFGNTNRRKSSLI